MSFFDVSNGPRTGGKLVFLQGLTAKEWSKVFTFAETRKFVAGELLVKAGDEDDSFYIMTSGSAEVLQGAKVIGQIAEGLVFGEVAFFDRQARSASIRALDAGTAARFSRSAFENLAAWEPVLARRMLYELGNALAIRLRAAEQRLGPP
jgi:CRP/FNR family transcriptional regulator, cyclic AMP receptor protein